MASGATSEDAFLAKMKVQVVAPPDKKKQPRPSGSRTPELPVIPGLVEMVQESYDDGEYMLLSSPPSYVERVRHELQAARRYLIWQHRQDHPEEDDLDVRGLSKPEIVIVDPADTDPEGEYGKYLKMIRKGEVGVLFMARPPQMRGIRARRAASEGVQTRQSRAEYKRNWRAKQKEQRATATVTQIRQSGGGGGRGRSDLIGKAADPFSG